MSLLRFQNAKSCAFKTGNGLTPEYARLVSPTLGEAFSPAVERKQTCRLHCAMSANDAVDGASSEASKCYRVVASVNDLRR